MNIYLSCCLITKITSKRFLVKFDSFQRPLPTFSVVAVLLICSFLSKILSVFKRFGSSLKKNVISENKTSVCILAIKNPFKPFQCALAVFDVFLVF